MSRGIVPAMKSTFLRIITHGFTPQCLHTPMYASAMCGRRRALRVVAAVAMVVGVLLRCRLAAQSTLLHPDVAHQAVEPGHAIAFPSFHSPQLPVAPELAAPGAMRFPTSVISSLPHGSVVGQVLRRTYAALTGWLSAQSPPCTVHGHQCLLGSVLLLSDCPMWPPHT